MKSLAGDLAAEAHRLHLRISIDGPAGSGKTTVGTGLADALGCLYLDTGLMYRGVTLNALEHGVSPADGPALAALARTMTFDLGGPGGSLLVNGRPAGVELRSPRVDAAVSRVSSHPEVREIMVHRQRELAALGCIVMVGRDIGTVVLPDADVKLWIVASPGERARRRLQEHLPGAAGLSLAETEARIRARDALDAGRLMSPLRRPGGAVDIDTDGQTPAQSIRLALNAISLALSAPEQDGGKGHG